MNIIGPVEVATMVGVPERQILMWAWDETGGPPRFGGTKSKPTYDYDAVSAWVAVRRERVLENDRKRSTVSFRSPYVRPNRVATP